MVDGALVKVSVLRVDLGVGRGWLTRRAGAFAGGLLTFALVSGFQFA